jgi:hypothetical protein
MDVGYYDRGRVMDEGFLLVFAPLACEVADLVEVRIESGRVVIDM